MMIRILQISTIIIFLMMMMGGIITFIIFPSKLDDFQKLIDILFPIFISQVIPALIGTPLTEAVRNLTNKGEKNGQK